MKGRTILFWCVLGVVSIFLNPCRTLAQALDQTLLVVQSTGVGAINYGDKAAARDRAIDDAMRKAVEQTLGVIIDSQTKVENYMMVEDRILNWSRGYVKNYRILSEGQQAPDIYQVQIEATLDNKNLISDAQAVQNLIQNMGNPRVMFLIDEQNIGDAADRYHYFTVDMTASETAMINRFSEKGFEMVDPMTVRQNKQRESVLAAINGDAKAAATIAAALDAEVVVTGKAVATVATGINLGGMKSCQANLTARVVDADVGTIIATGSKHAAYPHIDEVTGGTLAIQKAANGLADDLINKILEKWRNKFYNLNSVKLVVSGLTDFSVASDLKNQLQYAVRGIKNIFPRNVAGGTAEFDIQISGNAEQLARELDRRQIETLSFQVTGVTANRVSLKVVSTESPVDPTKM